MVNRRRVANRIVFSMLLPIALASCDVFWNYDLVRLPTLRKDQMYQDYDYLTRVIREVSPFITLQKKAYGLDMLQVLADRRGDIESISTPAQFYLFLDQVLGRLRSQHLNVDNNWHPPDTGILDLILQGELYDHQGYAGNVRLSWGLPVSYWNGRYVAWADVGGTTVPQGSVLASIDGEPVQSVLERSAPWTLAYSVIDIFIASKCSSVPDFTLSATSAVPIAS